MIYDLNPSNLGRTQFFLFFVVIALSSARTAEWWR